MPWSSFLIATFICWNSCNFISSSVSRHRFPAIRKKEEGRVLCYIVWFNSTEPGMYELRTTVRCQTIGIEHYAKPAVTHITDKRTQIICHSFPELMCTRMKYLVIGCAKEKLEATFLSTKPKYKKILQKIPAPSFTLL